MKPFYDLLSLQHAGTLKSDNRKIRYMSEELIRKDGSPANGIALFRSSDLLDQMISIPAKKPGDFGFIDPFIVLWHSFGTISGP